MVALAVTAIEAVRSAGIEVRVFAAAREEVALILTAIVLEGSDKVQLEADMKLAILALTDNLKPGNILYIHTAEAQAWAVDKIRVKTVKVTSSTTDISPSAPINSLRVLSGSITINFVEVPS